MTVRVLIINTHHIQLIDNYTLVILKHLNKCIFKRKCVKMYEKFTGKSYLLYLYKSIYI